MSPSVESLGWGKRLSYSCREMSMALGCSMVECRTLSAARVDRPSLRHEERLLLHAEVLTNLPRKRMPQNILARI